MYKKCSPKPPETRTVHPGEKPFILRVKKLNDTELKTFILFLNVQTIVSKEMGLSKKRLCISCCHETPPRPLPLSNIFHRVFVGATTCRTCESRACEWKGGSSWSSSTPPAIWKCQKGTAVASRCWASGC